MSQTLLDETTDLSLGLDLSKHIFSTTACSVVLDVERHVFSDAQEGMFSA